jgi:predicted dienelactone hydrolase
MQINAKPQSPARRQYLLATSAWAATLIAAPLAAQSTRAGQSLDEDWTDVTRRGRTLPVKLRIPATPGPWPVVIFSHGLGGSREGGAQWGKAWSEAGFLVLHLQHPGSDGPAIRQSGRDAMSPGQAEARVQDVQFALDEMARRKAANQGPWAMADLSRIGMSGHSFGARTTYLMAGESTRAGRVDEPRLRAFIAFSPSVTNRTDLAKAFGTVRGPMFNITGTLDGDVVGNGETAEGRAAVFDYLQPGDKYLWVLKDADHMTFSGQQGRRAATRMLRRPETAIKAEPAQQQQIATLTTIYWNAMLKGDLTARTQLQQPAAVQPGDVWKRK